MMNPVPAGMVGDSVKVSGMAIRDESKAARRRSMLKQQVKDPPGGAPVGASGLPRRGGMGLSGGASGTAMGGGVESVDVPGVLTNCGGETEGEVLRVGERLEMVDDDGAVGEGGQGIEGERGEEEGMATETGGAAGDGVGRAAEGAGDLTMGGAGLEQCSDGDGELGELEVVGEGEGLEREGAQAREAAESGNGAAVQWTHEDAVPMEAEGASWGGVMVTAVRPGAERRPEAPVVLLLHGNGGPIHGASW
jgi:hypothetical protein